GLPRTGADRRPGRRSVGPASRWRRALARLETTGAPASGAPAGGPDGEGLTQFEDLLPQVIDGRPAVLETAGHELGLRGVRAVAGRDLPGGRAVPGADGLRELAVLEQRPGLILQSDAGLELAGADRAEEPAPTTRLGEVVDADAARKQAEPQGYGRLT